MLLERHDSESNTWCTAVGEGRLLNSAVDFHFMCAAGTLETNVPTQTKACTKLLCMWYLYGEHLLSISLEKKMQG